MDEPSIFRSWLTLEPMWMFITMSLGAGLSSIKNFILNRACTTDLGYSKEECLNSSGNAAIELAIQEKIATYNVTSSSIGAFITVVIFLFLGPWSDKSGRRKPLISMPILGMMCSSINMTILYFIVDLSVVWVIYAEAIPLAIGGNYSILFMSASNYLGDISFHTRRSIATLMATNGATISAFMAISSIATPYFYQFTGFLGVFIYCLSFETLGLFYVLWRVKDIKVSETIPNIFDYKLPWSAAECVFRKRPGYKRWNILLMAIVPCCNSMIDSTENAINYLYLRNKFAWTEIKYGYFMTMRLIVYTLSCIIVSNLAEKCKWSERRIGVLSAISQISATILFMLGSNTTLIFMSNLLAIFSRGAMLMERQVLNKQISGNEQGSVNTLTVVFEKFASLLCTPMANFVYSITLKSFPSCYILISIGAAFIEMICYILVKEEAVDEHLVEYNMNENRCLQPGDSENARNYDSVSNS